LSSSTIYSEFDPNHQSLESTQTQQMLKSCLKVEHIFPQPQALHLTLLQPSLSLESNPETPLSKPGISWPLDSHLATTKLFYKERTTSPSPSLEEDTEMDDSTSEVPILGAYYASDRNEEDDMDEEGNTNPNIPAISFQDTMGTNYSFHTLLAQYQEHLLSEQQKLSKVAFRPWEDPRALEEQQWQSRKGKAAAKNPTSKQIQKAQVHHSSALNTAPLTQHIQPSTLPIPPIAFFNNKGQAVGDDVDVDMDDVEVPPDSDEEDQLEDDDLPAGPPSPSSLVQAPYIEPLEAPLNARATAIAKTRAREAYYGRHRKPIIRRDRRSGTRDATRARARQSVEESRQERCAGVVCPTPRASSSCAVLDYWEAVVGQPQGCWSRRWGNLVECGCWTSTRREWKDSRTDEA
jgi:hypothetical protein